MQRFNLALYEQFPTPEIILNSGTMAESVWWEFFIARIRNKNTRFAYLRAIQDFVTFCEGRGLLSLSELKPVHIAGWVEYRLQVRSIATVKQQLSALKNLFNWLVINQVLTHNPAIVVKPPRESLFVGKTPILTPEETQALLDAIPSDTSSGVRDRALFATMVYTFARITAALNLDMTDLQRRNRNTWMIFREKGGLYHEMPCHHKLEDHLQVYLHNRGNSDGPLFQTIDRKTKKFAGTRLNRRNALAAVKRRARATGLDPAHLCNHSFRGTGITTFLLRSSTKLETAQRMAGHKDPRSTQLYARRNKAISLAEVEQINI